MSSGANNLALPAGSWRSRMNSHVPNNNDWNYSHSVVPRPVPFRPPVASEGGQDSWRLFEERVRTGPYGLTSFPGQPHSPIRILVLDNEMARMVNPRLREFIRESPPRIMGEMHMQLPPQEEESRLTQEEQKKTLKKLKKQIYNPLPKRKSRNWCLYYRDRVGNRVDGKEEEKDEDSKSCAICLEDFFASQEVLVTPCNHMFHEECIVPWVKSNGQCPVCRFQLCEQRREPALPLNNRNNNIANATPNDIAAMELMALIRAMEEAFQWVNIRR
ncbi:hypothetical protein HHK36_023496 [Tetracentron sinense]|uniref:RING-type domain-containing protein n=1 Tax=Tetracentron sinense TaxID=13715 RepID=A0A834YLI3_TETSI|nr:hypothetical protein HHK36_023496 [Tetracentron sinense]